MQSDRSAYAQSWFRSPGGRRYGRDFAFLILAKIILLTILYFVFVAPQPHADTSSAALRARILDTAAATDSEHADR
jgi:hypothetical protein